MKTKVRYPYFIAVNGVFGFGRALEESEEKYLTEKLYSVLRNFTDDDRPILVEVQAKENPQFTGDKT